VALSASGRANCDTINHYQEYQQALMSLQPAVDLGVYCRLDCLPILPHRN